MSFMDIPSPIHSIVRRSYVFRVLFLGCAGAATMAAVAVAAPPASVTASASVVSQYMFRGLRLNAAGLQPNVEVSAGNLVLGTWANVPLRDKVRDGSDPEIDLYGAYTLPLDAAWSIAPGFTSYHFPHAPTSAGFYRSTLEPNLAVNYAGNGFRITPKVFYDLELRGPTAELSGFYAYPLKAWGTELDLTATVGTYRWRDAANRAAPAVKTWGDYWLLGAAVPFQVSRQAKVTIGFAYTEGRNAFTKKGVLGKTRNPLATGRGVASINYAFAF
jgi:uncharacterized protein (TIGR02001 family)